MLTSDGPPLPRGDVAFRAILRAPGLDDQARGRLLVRRGEELMGGEPSGWDEAIDSYVTALREHGVSARVAGWPEPFRGRAVERVLAAARDGRHESGADIVDVLVLGGSGSRPLPVELVAALQEQAEISTIFSSAVGRMTERQVESSNSSPPPSVQPSSNRASQTSASIPTRVLVMV